jgi:hypothetical protein
LDSLLAAQPPRDLRAVVVVENGEKWGAEGVVRDFAGALPIVYAFSEKANKSDSLNLALRGFALPTDFVLFFDDDIRIGETTLIAYEREGKVQTEGLFFVGAMGVDYQTPPPEWIREYLPPSATGWQPSHQKMQLATPDGQGCNWAAYASDLMRLGGFDSRYGPGSGARGQETNMFRRLLAAGVISIFLPDAKVYHYVPEERCSPRWILDRLREHGRAEGLNQRLLGSGQASFLLRTLRQIAQSASRWICTAAIQGQEKSFSWRRALSYYSGSLAAFVTAKRPG